MANQIESNLFEELTDADSMAVIGGAVYYLGYEDEARPTGLGFFNSETGERGTPNVSQISIPDAFVFGRNTTEDLFSQVRG